MTPQTKRNVLGRGLAALLPDQHPTNGTQGEYVHAALEDIYPSPEQPRKRFDDENLEELAQSIRSVGILQPLVTRPRPTGGFYLIAGERRWRAAQRAGLRQVPILIKEVAENEAFERALIENLQRADLNPIEEALAYNRLAEEFHYTQQQIAERVGKNRSSVANSLRLLRLPHSIRAMVEDNRLTMGHARALLGLESPAAMEPLAQTLLAKRLSVRETEELIRQHSETKDTPQQPTTPSKTPIVRDLENRLTQSLGSAVAIHQSKRGNGGRIEIRYTDLDHLDQLLERLLP